MSADGAVIGIGMNGANMSSTETGIIIDGVIAMGGVIESGAVTVNFVATTGTVTDTDSLKGMIRNGWR